VHQARRGWRDSASVFPGCANFLGHWQCEHRLRSLSDGDSSRGNRTWQLTTGKADSWVHWVPLRVGCVLDSSFPLHACTNNKPYTPQALAGTGGVCLVVAGLVYVHCAYLKIPGYRNIIILDITTVVAAGGSSSRRRSQGRDARHKVGRFTAFSNPQCNVSAYFSLACCIKCHAQPCLALF
jgi:hypothetical protein